MNSSFEFITNLQYKVKNLSERVQAFESGDRYKKIQLDFKTQLSKKDRVIQRLKSELADANCRTVTVRQNWLQVFDDLEKEHGKELQKKDHRIKKLEEKVLNAETRIDELKAKNIEIIRELYQVKTQLEEEQGKNQKLIAQINRDYENSSIPSSMNPNHKKISNSREKTDRKPGGQPGHSGHGRKKLTPTNRIHIPPPLKYANSTDYKPTGKIITKQLIDLHIGISVNEFYTPEYRNRKTGQRVHAEFPTGISNDVNYGGSIKSFLFLLNNRCCVSIDKAKDFLSELTDNTLNISKGMINGLSKEFSNKTKAEQNKIFSDLILSPVLNTDCTNARVGGKNMFVYVCATPDRTMYFARENKGHKGVKQTPVEDYQGILVHDHDKTFYNYGNNHQECLAHVLRYLKDSMENESNLKWNKQMYKLLHRMIRYRNSHNPEDPPDADVIKEFELEYKDILIVAKGEYEYEPPSKYYKDGYNLYKRLNKYIKNHLLFLHNFSVPANNNLSERLLRVFKRKQKQVMAFRSFENLDYLCRSMSMINLLSTKNENLYAYITNIFNDTAPTPTDN